MSSDAQRENKTLMGIFVGLTFIVVVLAVGIVCANLIDSETKTTTSFYEFKNGMEPLPGQYSVIEPSTETFIFRENVQKKLLDDSSYDLFDAKKDFEDYYSSSNETLKVYIAIAFAQLSFDNTGNIEIAKGLLNNVKSIMSEKDAIYYYLSLQTLYGEMGEEELAEKCYKRAMELRQKIIEENEYDERA